MDKASCGSFYYNYYHGVMTRLSAKRAFSLGVVILAAGRSARMGQPKLLLPWGGTSVLGHLIEQWRALGAKQIAVVCAPGDEAIQAELDRLGFPAAEPHLQSSPRARHVQFDSMRGAMAGMAGGAHALGDCAGRSAAFAAADTAAGARFQRRAPRQGLPARAARPWTPSRPAAQSRVPATGRLNGRDAEGVSRAPGPPKSPFVNWTIPGWTWTLTGRRITTRRLT